MKSIDQTNRRFHKWFDISIFNLGIVALLGLVLRSKMVFALPFINYNRLLEAHAHFSVGGWAILSLMGLLTSELLPDSLNKRTAYQWLTGGILIGAWAMLITFQFGGYSSFSTIASGFFIMVSYIWAGIFLADLLKTKAAPPVKLLAASAVVCLILSTSGTIVITYIYYSKFFDAILYRNALFTYLHFLYNGFFTLSVFALLFNHTSQKTSSIARKNILWFSSALCISVIPSLFITYLWQDPNGWMRPIAIIGCMLLLACFFLFLVTTRSFKAMYANEKPVLRFLVFISMGSFILKTVLQGFTIFPVIGNAIFGNRPVIMGFLHMVFLAFVTLFILAYYIRKEIFNPELKWVNVGVYLFAIAIVLNEVLLFTQGLTTMLMAGSMMFVWLLWITGIILFLGAVLIIYGRIRSGKHLYNYLDGESF
jgi:hypothetical protein